MPDNINILIIQPDIEWERPEQNLRNHLQKIESMKGSADLILLPEMFSTGFSMRPAPIAEPMNGRTVDWMGKVAREKGAAMGGSLIVVENGYFFNRFVVYEPGGKIHWYDKRHLFRMQDEEKHYKAGSERTVIQFRDWRICPQVCYDLRFPVWSRNRNDYDLLVYVANWPEARKEVWQTLLKARALENLAYVIGVNRIGEDRNGISYSGNSMVIGPRGDIIADAGESETTLEVTLSLKELREFREKFPAHLDADDFSLHI